MTNPRSQSGDRWLDHAIAVLPDRWVKATWKNDGPSLRKLFIPPYQAMDITGLELEKTPDELTAIRTMGQAANRLLAEFGQPPQDIDPTLIHFLEDTAATDELLEGGEAVTTCGRIYLRRRPDLEWNVFILTHELAHLIAFTVMLMRTARKSGGTGLEVTELALQRSGLGRHDKRLGGPYRTRFLALNEAVTEMVASGIRKRLPDDGPLARLISLDDVRTMVSEWQALELTVALYQSLAADAAERRVLRRMLVNDYLTCNRDFLRLLTERRPEAVKLLLSLNAKPTDIAVAADVLGFAALAERIREP